MEQYHLHGGVNLRIPFLFFFISFSFLPYLSSSAFTPDTSLLLNCGSTATVTPADDIRVFFPDSSKSASFSISPESSVSLSDPNPSPGTPTLYRTARVFTERSSYEFTVNSPGAHVVRLHFFPFPAPNYDLASAVFSIYALGSFLLLSDFSVTNQTTSNPNNKEYILWVESDKLEITFTPSSSKSPPLAFVSAVEVFTAPGNLIGKFDGFDGLPGHVLETVHRINMGGPLIVPSNDTLWRIWNTDVDFLLNKEAAVEVNTSQPVRYRSDGTGSTPEIAPDRVYSTAQQMNVKNMNEPRFNITWVFTVKSGYAYLIRMHFCDFTSSSSDQLVFDVYINNQSAYRDLQPGSITDRNLAVPFYMDFPIAQAGNFMDISVGRSDKSSSSNVNAILNGLEIMKINNLHRSLDGEFNTYYPEDSRGNYRSNKKLIAILISSILGGLALLILLITALFLLRKSRSKPHEPREPAVSWSPLPGHGRNSVSTLSKSTQQGTNASPRVNLSLHISFDELKLATDGFDEKLVIGSGGFGKVYKGVLRDGTKVAVKRGTPDSMQGYPEFQTEIMVLSRIRHGHLVSLVGYCEEHSQMILVYEYMENGPLKNFLHGSDSPFLSWKQRLKICIGAARGIHYLHTGDSQAIIHRDVKSSNILLGEDYLAKVSDFGLSRLGPSLGETHVSTAVKGSFGYLDPEYFKTRRLTDRSDVYSFGVVLFEVLCARPVIDPLFQRDKLNLADWATHWQGRGLLEQIVDPRLKGKINSNSLRKFGETAAKCLEEHGVDRPTIGDVLWNLEYCLQLQETELRREPYEDSVNRESGIPVVAAVRRVPSSSGRIGEGGDATEMGEERSDHATTSNVFSQLITPAGR